MGATLFERYGGFAGVRRIISDFYDRVLDSPVLAPRFAQVDMRALIDHQAKFISSMMGGPASFTDEHLRRVHRGMSISTAEFREMIATLEETLEDFGMAPSDVAQVVGQIRKREGVVVERPEP